ncbi:MAG: IS630 family transposase [archaeon]|nr:IS630 family transposase [archaeon]
MMRSEYYEILSKEREEIRKRLKKEKDTKVKLKLALLNMVASGMSVKEAASFLGIKLRSAYKWVNNWMEEGYEGMLAKKRGGRPPKLSKEQKEELRRLLKQKEYWTTEEINELINEKFGVEYKKSRLYELLRELGLKLSKPYILDVKRPENAEEILAERLEKVLKVLKDAEYNLKDIFIGFFDASSPQLSPNTTRLWSFKKIKIRRITSRQRERANTFGFYTLNGNSVVNFQERSKKENVIEVLRAIREENGDKPIVIIIDNFSSHKAGDVQREAEKLGIHLVFLPPYSPDLNPIEFVWKSLKRLISEVFIGSVEDLKSFIKEKITDLFRNRGYAKGWFEKFSSIFQKIFGHYFCNLLAE